jgi:hypothetical protein
MQAPQLSDLDVNCMDCHNNAAHIKSHHDLFVSSPFDPDRQAEWLKHRFLIYLHLAENVDLKL